MNKSYDEFFDKILLDAPCSASDQRPKLISSSKNVAMVPVQRSLMQRAGEMLKTGGVLVYSTCSIHNEENGHNVKWFMDKFGEHFELLEEIIFDPWSKCDVKNDDNGIIRLQNIESSVDDDTIGFFISKFKKVRSF